MDAGARPRTWTARRPRRRRSAPRAGRSRRSPSEIWSMTSRTQAMPTSRGTEYSISLKRVLRMLTEDPARVDGHRRLDRLRDLVGEVADPGEQRRGQEQLQRLPAAPRPPPASAADCASARPVVPRRWTRSTPSRQCGSGKNSKWRCRATVVVELGQHGRTGTRASCAPRRWAPARRLRDEQAAEAHRGDRADQVRRHRPVVLAAGRC